jgi:ribonuclease-3
MEPLTKEIVEDLVGSRVKNFTLYQTAFTHKSAVKHGDDIKAYETIEFMGDSILGFIITKYLYDRYEHRQEGFLTRARTRLVRGKTLAIIADRMGLGKYVTMDEKGIRNRWFQNPKILEDVFESLVGAIYLDLGMIYAKRFVLTRFEWCGLFNEEVISGDDNFKDQLMRMCQASKFSLPHYQVSSSRARTHAHRFSVMTTVNDVVISIGHGTTKKEAEQVSAKMAIENWNDYFSVTHASPSAETFGKDVR